MKNYEVKYATKELADKKIVKVQQTNKRLAYLVSNMFTKMKNGFAKKVNPIIVVFQEEQASRVVEKEEVKVEPKQVEVKLNTEDLKTVFNDFLHDFKATFEQPKVEEVKKEEIKINEQKVEEVKVEEKPTIDDEKLKADMEKYAKMLAEME